MTLNWTKQNISTYGIDDAMPIVPYFVFSPDGQTIGLSDSGDIYLSYDSGASWEIYSGLKDAGYNSGLVALTNTSIMYVVSQRIYYRHDKSTGQTVMIKDTSNYFPGGARLNASETGQYLSMADISGYNYRTANYYVSDDYGNSWSNPFSFDSSYNKNMINTMDNTGQYQAVFTTNEYVVLVGNLYYRHNCIYTSSDYGASWTKVLDLTDTDVPGFYGLETGGFESNYHNSTMCIAYTTGTFPHLILHCYVTHNSGASWHATTINSDTRVNYGQYTMDYSGQYIIWVGSNYDTGGKNTIISQDYGETWTKVYPPATPSLISIRPTEHEVWASFSNYTAAISTDWFNTWTPISPFVGQNIKGNWLTKASSDGTKFLVAKYNGGHAYVGNNNNIWQKANIAASISLNIESCAISGNGQYMLVGEYSRTSLSGRLYLSINGGGAWNEITPSGIAESLDWYSVAINYSGQYMLAGEYSQDNLYFSSNYGVSWTLINEGGGYAEGACINNGGSVLVATGWGGIYISLNYGVTWILKSENYSVGPSCTALGNIMYVTDGGYKIWQSLNYGSTWTELTPNDNAYYTTCSDDNNIVLFADKTMGLYSSTDRINWTFELPTMYDVSSDGSGIKIICGQIGGYVYMSGPFAASFKISTISWSDIKLVSNTLKSDTKKVSSVSAA